MVPYGPPQYPPPNVTPQKPKYSYIIDCMYSYSYIWPKSGKPFWFYPTRIEQGEVSGYAWTGSRWTFYGFDEKMIDQVTCEQIPMLY